MAVNIDIEDHRYGKSNIKLLYVNKETTRHEAFEYEIDISLKLENTNDYTIECNKSVIATDSQKNTVYILTKKYGVSSPEEFGMRLCKHFLATYAQVVSVVVKIVQLPWNRIKMNKAEHNHAFYSGGDNAGDNTERRIAKISQYKNGVAIVSGGIEGFSLLKTAQSGFTGFVDDEYRSLADSKDRVFRTIVSATWEYQENCSSIDFNGVYNRIRNIVIESFAGHCKIGVYSPSVQRTLFRTSEQILNYIAEIKEVSIKMPNVHYMDFDFTKFPKLLSDKEIKNDYHVYVPVEKPNGVIFGKFKRNESKL